MKADPYEVVRDFEGALCEYTGAPYAVTTTSCTMALLLAVAWHGRHGAGRPAPIGYPEWEIEIPKRTYVGVAMSIIHAGGRPSFRDEEWLGAYQLKPLPVFDSARWLTSGLWRATHIPGTRGPWFGPGAMVCLSFHWGKTLGIQQGGAILLDDVEADGWLRRARFDGRREGIAPKDQLDWQIGWHCYMAPETAAAGLVRLANLPRHNEPLPNDDYPDLSQMEIFR